MPHLTFFLKNRVLRGILLILFISCAFYPNILLVTSSPPTWLRVGAYAEYGPGEITWLTFVNGTTRNYIQQRTLPKLSIRWECTKVVENGLTFNVTIAIAEEARTLRFTSLAHADAESRNATSSDASYLGKTVFWLSPNPKDGETITLTEGRLGIVRILPGSTDTIQGSQRFFIINNGEGVYDSDTGILLSSDFTSEAMLRALNVSKPSPGGWGLSKTNVDLGPRELWPEIARMLPVLMPVTAFVLIAAALLYRRRRKHKLLEQRLKSPTRKRT